MGKRQSKRMSILVLIFTMIFCNFSTLFDQTTVFASTEPSGGNTADSFYWTKSSYLKADTFMMPDVGTPMAVSPDGRYVYYLANSQLYRFDRLESLPEKMLGLSEGDFVEISHFSVSKDGRFLVFAAKTNKLLNSNGEYEQVYLLELSNNKLTLISESPGGGEGDNDSSFPVINEDGSVIVFESAAKNLVPDETGYSTGIFVYEQDRLSLVSKTYQEDLNAESRYPSISEDGRYIAFSSLSDSFVEGDGNYSNDVFLIDRNDHSMKRISVTPAGEEADRDSTRPVISPDGGYVAFQSAATNLDPGSNSSGVNNLYLYGTGEGTVQLITAGSNGAGDADSTPVEFSPDGRYFSFYSDANNLTSDDQLESDRPSGMQTDAFVYDIQQESLHRLTSLLQNPASTLTSTAVFTEDMKSVLFASQLTYTNDGFEFTDQVLQSAYNPGDVPVWGAQASMTKEKLSETNVKLSWPAATGSGLLGYRVYQRDFQYAFITPDQERAVEAYIDPHHTLEFRVEAVSGNYQETNDGPRATVQAGQTEPYWQEGAGLVDQSATDHSLSFEWMPAYDDGEVSFYKVYLQDGTGLQEQLQTPETHVQLSNLTPDTEYAIVVRAFDNEGNASLKDLTFTLRTLEEGAQVGTLNATFQAGKVELSWTAPAVDRPVDQYEVLRQAEGSTDFVKLATLGGDQLSYQDATAVSGKTYRYTVKGYNSSQKLVYVTNDADIFLAEKGIFGLYLNYERIEDSYLDPSKPLQLDVWATQGYLAKAKVTTVAVGSAETTETVVDLPFEQKWSMYRSSITIPAGTSSIQQIQVELSDLQGNKTTRDFLTKPLRVTATLNVTIDAVEERAKELNGGYLYAFKDGRIVRTLALTGPGQQNLTGLTESDHYTFAVYDQFGEQVAQSDEIGVKDGATQELTLPVARDARVQMKVTGPTDFPFSEFQVKVDYGPSRYMTSDDQGELALIKGLKPGDTLGVELSSMPAGYRLVSELEPVVLQEGVNQLQFQVEKIPTVTLTGKVVSENGAGIRATVNARANIGTHTYSFNTTSNADGTYSFDVYADQLWVSVTPATKNYEVLNKEVNLRSAIQPVQDFTLKSQDIGVIEVEVYTKQNGEWKGPVLLDTSSVYRYGIMYKKQGDPYESYAYSNPIEVTAKSGDTFDVCSRGTEQLGLSTDCTRVTLNEERAAKATLKLELIGAQVTGRAVSKTGEKIRLSQAQLYYKNPEGNWQFDSVQPLSFDQDTFFIPLRSQGEYKLSIGGFLESSSTAIQGSQTFTAAAGQLVQLGDVTLDSPGYFSMQGENGLTAGKTEVSPGNVVSYQVRYDNTMYVTAKGATVTLEVPEGTILLEDSIVQDGKKVTAQQVDGAYQISLGDIPSGTKGTIHYQLKLNDNYQSEELYARALIQFTLIEDAITETLGTSMVQVPKVSMQAPRSTQTLDVQVSGRALTGSNVKIYNGEALIGEAVVTETGYWSTYLTLPSLGDPAVYQLQAEVEKDGKKYRSLLNKVTYDSSYPTMTQIVMQQAGGARKVIDVTKGTAKFPYVFAPYRPLYFSVIFNNPDRVKNVWVHVGSLEPALAERKGQEFVANLVTQRNAGPVYVTYDVIQEEKFPDYPDKALSEPELRQKLPASIRNLEVKELKEAVYDPAANKATGSVTVSLPDGQSVKHSFTVRPAESALGVPSYKLEVNADGDLVFRYSDFYQVKALENKVATLRMQAAGPFKPGLTGVALGGTIVFERFRPKYNGVGDIGLFPLSLAIADQGTSETTGLFDRLGKLAERAGRCGGNADLALKIEGLQKLALFYEGLKGLNGYVWGVATKPFGLAGEAYSEGVSWGFGKAVDSTLEPQIQALEAEVDALPAIKDGCGPKSRYIDYGNPSGGGGSNGNGGGGSGGSGGSPAADPGWIYDPSGFVYEGMTSNRLVDVKATAFKKSDQGKWNLWDATWYEQFNPLLTDKDGRYGWNVPEGYWRVMWEKDGYQTAYSDDPGGYGEIKVLPPHFEVNQGLVSKVPPKVTTAQAVLSSQGQSWIDLTFSKPIQVGAGKLKPDTVTLIPTEDRPTPIPVTLEAQETEGNLAMKLRITPAEPLNLDATYRLTLQADGFYSYADVPFAESQVLEVKTEALDEIGPQFVGAQGDPNGKLIVLRFDEELNNKDLSLDSFRLTGTTAQIQSVLLDPEDAKQVLVMLRGRLAASENVSMTVQKEAVVDRSQNYNHGASQPVTNQVFSSNNMLTSFGLSTGRLSPTFSADTTSYTLTVGNEVQELTLRPVVAHPKAALAINGTDHLIGTDIVVDVSATKTVLSLRVSAENGSERTYILKVVHGDVEQQQPGRGNHSGGSDPAVPTPGVGEKVTKVRLEDLTKLVKDKQIEYKLGSDVTGLELTSEAWNSLKQQGYILKVEDPKTKARLVLDGTKLAESAKGVTLSITQAAVTSYPAGYSGQSDAIRVLVQVEGKPIPLVGKLEIPAFGVGEDRELMGVYEVTDGAPVYLGSAEKGENLAIPVEGGGTFAILSYQKSYSDVATGHWAEKSIRVLTAHHVLSGITNTTFAPGEKVTRAQLAHMMAKLLGLKASDETTSFRDVAANSWYAESVKAVQQAKLFVGNGGQFRPNDQMTREELAVVMARLLDYQEGEATRFADQQQMSGWAVSAIDLAVKNGLMKGRGNNQFAPKAQTTRAEAATVLYQLRQLVK